MSVLVFIGGISWIHLEIDNEEKGSFTAIPTIEKQDLEQPVQWRNRPVNEETNTKISSAKIKPIQPARSFPETNHLSNSKKRRQTVRRTVQFSFDGEIPRIDRHFSNLRVFKFVMKISVRSSAIYHQMNN